MIRAYFDAFHKAHQRLAKMASNRPATLKLCDQFYLKFIGNDIFQPMTPGLCPEVPNSRLGAGWISLVEEG